MGSREPDTEADTKTVPQGGERTALMKAYESGTEGHLMTAPGASSAAPFVRRHSTP